ncbi:hypothetical protein [Candidatus Mycoplasma mahonii]|uniref:hypothetical protein n=1 Tax=Candidatus Mycoplasma mahonii TaxID=3004105 RepID=UPI0026EEC543|nr:hypothetical protein [Candidatus Mycoplasma mahonii]WKX02219.1 hypothetical protein O3I44_02330 [Candidatus Mycoplasma mahonii]
MFDDNEKDPDKLVYDNALDDNGDSGTINGYAFPTISKAGYMTYAQALIVYFTFLGIFMGGPFLNRYLSKKFEKIEVIIDTQNIKK